MPIRQDQAYHRFVDSRQIWGIPNFWNVVSNLPFAAFGIAGLRFLFSERSRSSFDDPRERWAYVFFFLGVFGTAFGSGYYHWAPGNLSLFWDRLPMAVAFSALFAAIISERISSRAGLTLLPLFLVGGLIGIGLWGWQERQAIGSGDLRAYAFTQYFPWIAIPVVCGLFPARYAGGKHLLFAAAWYGAAKGFEFFDEPVFAAGQLLSGHSLKHIAASLSTWEILNMLRRRSR